MLNGPHAAVERVAGELCHAGAVALPGGAPLRLVWSIGDPGTLEAMSRRHPDVAVSVERFEMLGDELVRLVIQGGVATVLDRRRLGPGPDGEMLPDWGQCIDEGGELLDPDLLRRAAHMVAAVPPDIGPGALSSAPRDALVLGRALGRLCACGGDPYADDAPAPAMLAAVRDMGACALAVAAAGRAMCNAECAVERAWHLTQAVAHAGAEERWDAPGEAYWPEWLMSILVGASAAIDECGACIVRPDDGVEALHAEHWPTPDERREAACGGLVSTCLQALALFDVERV